MPRHLTIDELNAGLPEILAAPKDEGSLRAIIIRPAKGERCDLESCEISLALVTNGDHWAKGCWKSTCAPLATSRGRPVYRNGSVTREYAPDTRLGIGSAEIEITDVPHNGCAAFVRRYGRDAAVFVTS